MAEDSVGEEEDLVAAVVAAEAVADAEAEEDVGAKSIR